MTITTLRTVSPQPTTAPLPVDARDPGFTLIPLCAEAPRLTRAQERALAVLLDAGLLAGPR